MFKLQCPGTCIERNHIVLFLSHYTHAVSIPLNDWQLTVSSLLRLGQKLSLIFAVISFESLPSRHLKVFPSQVIPNIVSKDYNELEAQWTHNRKRVTNSEKRTEPSLSITSIIFSISLKGTDCSRLKLPPGAIPQCNFQVLLLKCISN